MKIAVVSQQNSIGSSSFCVLLSTVFAVTQAQKTVVMSTSSVEPMFNMCNTIENKSPLKSFSVYQAMLESNSIRGEDLYDYAYRLGRVDAFAFDFVGKAKKTESIQASFISMLKTLKADMVLVEAAGDVEDPFNKAVLQSVDAVLYLFDASPGGIEKLKHYKEVTSPQVVARTLYVCMKYDRDTINEKRIAAAAEIAQRNLYQFPYNPIVIRECLNSNLDSLINKIVAGSPEVLNLRPEMLKIMQGLYDDGKMKYIRGFDRWVR